MLFDKKATNNSYHEFLDLIEENTFHFGDAIKEKQAEIGERELTDEEFVECYIEGMKRLVITLHHKAYNNLLGDSKAIDRYMGAYENPKKHGFRFANEEITVGKVYLFYVYALTNRKASKSDCIKLERYTVSLIGQQFLNLGIVK